MEYKLKMKYLKTIFFTLNVLLITFYIYPGSIFGCFFYNDCLIQPQITKDFIVSSNHFYVFLFISTLGLFIFENNRKKILIYLFSLSLFLELSHLIIPNRSFQFADLFGNILGILLSLIIINLLIYWRKK